MNDVHFSYLGKFPALAGFDLVIENGSKTAVIGANGTGKSTLLLILDALLFPDKGAVTAFGEVLSEERFVDQEFSRLFRRRVAFVFQSPDVQLFCPTVRDDIVFGPLHLGVETALINKRLDWVVNLLKVTSLLDRAPHQLSVGEKKKVALASVLINDPEVLLLDEPTAGLDPQTVRDIVDVLLHLNEAGKTIITATHDLHLVADIADTVHVFGKEKKIIRSGTPDEILADQAFLRANNLIHIHRHFHDNKLHVHLHPHGHEH